MTYVKSQTAENGLANCSRVWGRRDWKTGYKDFVIGHEDGHMGVQECPYNMSTSQKRHEPTG